jgi:predicted component of type VI protein secretion system
MRTPSSPGPFSASQPHSLSEFLTQFRVAVIVLSGDAEGMEHVVDQPRVLLGRGPGVDLVVDDPSMERIHVALEFDGTGYRIGPVSPDGDLVLNGSSAGSERLKNEDRFCAGKVLFSYVVEPRRGRTL